MTDRQEPIPRPAARVLLCDEVGRVLLFKAQFEGRGRSFWITPGGGVNDGETYEEAAIRELWEETGIQISSAELVCAWVRSHTFEFRGRLIEQRERYYLARCGHEPPISYTNWEEIERQDLILHRWWTCDEIEASGEDFAPRRLGCFLRDLLRDGCPADPVNVGL